MDTIYNRLIAENRIGYFQVFKSLVLYVESDKLLKFFGNFIVVEVNYDHEKYYYKAYSPIFDPVPPGKDCPEYVIAITIEADDAVDVTARKMINIVARNELVEAELEAKIWMK